MIQEICALSVGYWAVWAEAQCTCNPAAPSVPLLRPLLDGIWGLLTCSSGGSYNLVLTLLIRQLLPD